MLVFFLWWVFSAGICSAASFLAAATFFPTKEFCLPFFPTPGYLPGTPFLSDLASSVAADLPTWSFRFLTW